MKETSGMINGEIDFSYGVEALKAVIENILRQNLSTSNWDWLTDKAKLVREENNGAQLNASFAAISRKAGRANVVVAENQLAALQLLRKNFSIQTWTVDRLCRVWLLLQIDPSEKDKYVKKIEALFLAAEMNELVALYSALPVLAYPAEWVGRCAEGIRSNIGPVLEAIMCDNPYPSEYLAEPAWNQLVLKAFFTEKPVHRIVGLDERANQNLAAILSDYAHERWAAHRPVNPLLWRCVGKFINEQIFPDIVRIARSEKTIEREAAALACADSNYAPAHELLHTLPQLRAEIEAGTLTWDAVAHKAAATA